MAFFWRSLILCVLTLAHVAWAGSKPTFSIVFVVEGDEFEGKRMVQPITLNGKVKYFRRIPMITQKNIKAFYPFPARDGSYGVALRVDQTGWRNVRETGSLESGRLLAVLVNGRAVQTMAIDNPKKDDHIVVVWKGLTEAEVAILKKTYPEIGKGPAGKAEPIPELIDLTKPGTPDPTVPEIPSP